MSDQKYGGLIWTNHALERVTQRGLTQEKAWYTFRHPDKTASGKEPGTVEFTRKEQNSLIKVIATQNEKKEWIVISCWVDPPLSGSIDAFKQEEYKRYKKSGFFGKLIFSVKKQLGF